MDDIKWYFIAMIVIFTGGIAAGAYSDHQKSQCKISALQAHVNPADIEKVCQ